MGRGKHQGSKFSKKVDGGRSGSGSTHSNTGAASGGAPDRVICQHEAETWPMYVTHPDKPLVFPPTKAGRPGFSIDLIDHNKGVVRVEPDGPGQPGFQLLGLLHEVLNKAATESNLRLLQELVPLLTPEDINHCHPDAEGGRAALQWASRAGCLRCVKLLVAAGARLDVTDACGRTPLHGAAANSHTRVVQWLIQQGADVNAKSTSGEAIPLHFAVSDQGCGVACTRLLLEAGSDVDALDDSGSTPVHTAQCEGNVEAVRCLVAAGADVHSATCASANWTGLQALCALGASANNSPDTSAARVRQVVEMVRFLIEELGVDPHATMEPSSHFNGQPRSESGSTLSAFQLTTQCKSRASDGTRSHMPGQQKIGALLARLDAKRTAAAAAAAAAAVADPPTATGQATMVATVDGHSGPPGGRQEVQKGLVASLVSLVSQKLGLQKSTAAAAEEAADSSSTIDHSELERSSSSPSLVATSDEETEDESDEESEDESDEESEEESEDESEEESEDESEEESELVALATPALDMAAATESKLAAATTAAKKAAAAKDPEDMTRRELESQLAAVGVDYSDAIDKWELVELYMTHVVVDDCPSLI